MRRVSRWLDAWVRWSTFPGLARKLIGFGAPLVVLVAAFALVFASLTDDSSRGASVFEDVVSGAAASAADEAGIVSSDALTARADAEPAAPEEETIPPTSTPATPGYGAEASRLLGIYSQDLTAFTTHMAQIAQTPELLVNEEWRIQSATSIAGLKLTAQDLRALVPPPCAQDAHAKILEGIDQFEAAFGNLVILMDSLDLTRSDVATGQINNGIGLFNTAGAMLADRSGC